MWLHLLTVENEGADRAKGGRRRCRERKKPKEWEFTSFKTGLKVTVPNDVTALICWRLAAEHVFNQSVEQWHRRDSRLNYVQAPQPALSQAARLALSLTKSNKVLGGTGILK